jgi:hypothetical protein
MNNFFWFTWKYEDFIMDISIYSVSLTLLFKIHHFYEFLLLLISEFFTWMVLNWESTIYAGAALEKLADEKGIIMRFVIGRRSLF